MLVCGFQAQELLQEWGDAGGGQLPGAAGGVGRWGAGGSLVFADLREGCQ